MSDKRDLRMYVVPPGRGASFMLRREGGLVTIKPLSLQAAEWLGERVDAASWYEGVVVVEPRYMSDIVEGIIDAGFLFEGEKADDADH